jgi:hypothetical protein
MTKIYKNEAMAAVHEMMEGFHQGGGQIPFVTASLGVSVNSRPKLLCSD